MDNEEKQEINIFLSLEGAWNNCPKNRQFLM